MRDRLIRLIRAAEEDFTITCPRYSVDATHVRCDGCQYDMEDGSCDYTARKADYLFADGWMRPPCKVGDILYEPCQCFGRNVIVEYVVIAIQSSIRDEWIVRYKKIGSTVRRQCFISNIGKTIFLTKKEAKAALKGGVE